ncbi:hypothetical protein OC834_006927 [Tilletia horrida]|nr:hypothetical protein OC834_006927 [Tilletia horrida]
MDASKPIGDDLFAPPMHSTTPAGAIDDDDGDEHHHHAAAAAAVLPDPSMLNFGGSSTPSPSRAVGGVPPSAASPSPSSAAAAPALAFGGRPAPGTKLSQSSIPQYQLSPPSSLQQGQQQQQQQQPLSHQRGYGLAPGPSPALPIPGPSASFSNKALPPTPTSAPDSQPAQLEPLQTRISSSPQSFAPDPPAPASAAAAAAAPFHPAGAPAPSWPPVGSTGAAAAAAYVHAAPDIPPPRPPKILTLRTSPGAPHVLPPTAAGAAAYQPTATVIPIPMLSAGPAHIFPGPAAGAEAQMYARQATLGPGSDLDSDKTPVATVPPMQLHTYGARVQAPAHPNGPAFQAHTPTHGRPVPGGTAAAEPPSYASVADDTTEALPTFAQASAAAAAGGGGGGRFPRWRGWLEKRDLERRYAAMEEAAQAAAEGRVARKKSWGAGVHDADALPYEQERGDDDDDDDDDEEDEDEYEEYTDTADEEEEEGAGGSEEDAPHPAGAHGRHDSASSSSTRDEPRRRGRRRRRKRTGPPPPLHTHHFGSRFLPHLPSQPLCAAFLDVPPKPSTPTLAVATAAAGAAQQYNAPGARLWGGAARPPPPPPPTRAKPRMPQRRTVILIGTAEGLFAVELARPVRRRRHHHHHHHQRAAQDRGGSMSDGEVQDGARAARAARSGSGSGRGGGGAESDSETREPGASGAAAEAEAELDVDGEGWNGGIRIVQVWSGLGVFQLSILRSRPPPSAMFGPDGVTVPPAPRKSAGHTFMGGFGGFTPLGGFGGGGGGGSGAQAGEGPPGSGSSGGAILLALTAPAPALYALAPPLTRVSPFANTLLENSANATGGDRHHLHHLHHHHHHHARSHSHVTTHEDASALHGGKLPSVAMNLGPNVAPGCFGVDAGGGPGRAVPTTLSAGGGGGGVGGQGTGGGVPGGVSGGITTADTAAAAAAATLAGLTSGGTGSPNGQVRMWNLEAVRGCVAWALDSQQPCEPLDLLDRNGPGGKKAHKHARNKLSRAFKKVFAALGDNGSSTSSKAASRPGLSDSVSMDTVETLSTTRVGARQGKGKDREGEEKRKRAGQRTASDGSMVSPGWTLIDEHGGPSPTASAFTRSELDSDLGHNGGGGGGGYEESIRSVGTGTFGRSFDEDRQAFSPLSSETDIRSISEDPVASVLEASRRAALRLAMSSIVIPAGSGGGNTAGTLPGPTIPALEDERAGGASKKGKERSGGDRNGSLGPGGVAGAGGSAGTSGIGPVTSSSGSPKPVLFYAVHEASPGAKGAGTWYLALATSKTITVYEARPPRNDQRGNSSFLPISLQRGGGPSIGPSWTQNAQTVPGAETRSWSLLRELYTPQAPKAIAFAQASTTDIPLSTKEKGAGLQHQDSVLKPQFSGGMAGPRGWMGADLSLLVTFGSRAVIIRLTDLNVRDFDLTPNWIPPPPPSDARGPNLSSEALLSGAHAEDANALSVEPHAHGHGASLPVRGAGSASHHRRASSTSLNFNEEKQNWVGMHLVDVKIILKQSARTRGQTAFLSGGEPMSMTRSAEAALRSAGDLDVQPTPVFTSVLTPNAASEQRNFENLGLAANSHGPTGAPVRVSSTTSSSGADTESTTTNDDDEDDSLADGTGPDGDRSEIVYTATGRQAVALRDRSVHLSSGSRSDPTLTVVDRAGPTPKETSAPKRNPAQRRREREKHPEEKSSSGKLVSTSIALVTRGPSTQILPLPLPADLCKPKPLEVLNWSGVPNAVSGWARVVGLERERTTGAVSTADIGSRMTPRGARAQASADDPLNPGASGGGSVILHVNVTVLAFMASKVESQRKRVRVHVSLNFPLLRDVEIELVPVLDALLPMPVPTPVSQRPIPTPASAAGDANTTVETGRFSEDHQQQQQQARIKMKTNPRAYALGVSRANDMCICADPPRISSHSSTFDSDRRRTLAEPQTRTEQEFEYLSGMLVGMPHRGGVRPASVAALDVCRPREMRGDGGVLAWDWRGGRDYRLFFVGAEV